MNKTYNDAICQNQLEQFSEALSENQNWALKLVDTWAKVQAGFLSGNSVNFGDFDSCVEFKHNEIQGQFCWIILSPLQNSTFENNFHDINFKSLANFLHLNDIKSIKNGFCLPASCSAEDVIKFLNEQFLLANNLIAQNVECRTNDILNLNLYDYFAIFLFSLIIFLMVMCTIYEISMKHKNKKTDQLLTSFSIYTNGAKLFDTTKIKSENSLNCLHGLRALSIIWIITGHRFSNQFPWGNSIELVEFNKTFLSAIVRAHVMAVDTFFLMGALLMTLSTLKDCEKGNLNILRMIWKRYLRYTPVYAATMLVIICFSKYLITGPHNFEKLREPCVKNWWMLLLHIQNYLPADEMCLNHGWYLSADFQLFIISPFIILSIHKFGKKLLALPIILCLGTIIYAMSMSFIFDMRLDTLDPDERLKYYIRYVYFQTQSRAGPWFIGIILGYFMYQNQGKIMKISKWIDITMWILSLCVLSSIVILRYVLFNSTTLSTTAHSLQIGLERSIWACGLCWIIFACQNVKSGGFIRWFLSLSQWQPISRIGLSMYITGAVYQFCMIYNQRVPLFMNAWQVVPTLCSDIVIIIILSTLTYLAFEAPPMIIENYVYKKFQNTLKILKKSTQARA
ncbi:hypothetical protein PVAND_010631 [Polypedilum vanderplanki]|uniref:Nose resistant-to-fluoxetine protein N-terminal domain-containing protein n=1 Tax=Polypedilum vanderplanki TaxID=319348 RepID=A0A9J6CGV2_POLVA|nr:hypothetical protein PVAND_010631 [Polypedilum vanderplanki]